MNCNIRYREGKMRLQQLLIDQRVIYNLPIRSQNQRYAAVGVRHQWRSGETTKKKRENEIDDKLIQQTRIASQYSILYVIATIMILCALYTSSILCSTLADRFSLSLSLSSCSLFILSMTTDSFVISFFFFFYACCILYSLLLSLPSLPLRVQCSFMQW